MSRLRAKYKKLEERYERLKERHEDLLEIHAHQAELASLTNNIDKFTVSRTIDPRYEQGNQVDRTVAYDIANYLLENGYVERHVSNRGLFDQTIIRYTIQVVKPFK